MNQHLIFIYFFSTIAVIESTARLPYFPTGLPYGITPLHSNTGVITSPNYPNNYPNYGTTSANFVQSIYVPPSVQYVELTFTTFDIEECNLTCSCDGLHISAFTQPLCGNTLPGGDGVLKIDRHQIKDDHLDFYFYSDNTETRSGFYINYKIFYKTFKTTPYTRSTTQRCSYPACPYCPHGTFYSKNSYGCSVCSCLSAPSTTQNVAQKNNLLLQILTNLEHRTETLEHSAHDLQEQLQMVLGLIKGQVKRRIAEKK